MSHSSLAPHLHTEECNKYIDAYKDCQADLWKKFTNKCSPQFECMRKCLRREREFKRKNHKLRIHATDSFQGPKSQ